MRLRLTLEYDGGQFFGWQLQPDGPTVQGALEAALLQITGGPIRVIGAGRTDSGVHAKGQVAHCDVPDDLDPSRLWRALNGLLQGQVSVVELAPAAATFHARHHALRKRYRYRILNRRAPSPLRAPQTWHVGNPLALAEMRRAAEALAGHRDFAAFRGAPGGPPPKERTERTLERLSVERADDELQIVAEARGFLRYMVRNLAGALVAVGQGRLSPEQLAEICAAGDRACAPAPAPARGLCLERIWYRSETPSGSDPEGTPSEGA